jgi:hypothetical protein
VKNGRNRPFFTFLNLVERELDGIEDFHAGALGKFTHFTQMDCIRRRAPLCGFFNESLDLRRLALNAAPWHPARSHGRPDARPIAGDQEKKK